MRVVPIRAHCTLDCPFMYGSVHGSTTLAAGSRAVWVYIRSRSAILVSLCVCTCTLCPCMRACALVRCVCTIVGVRFREHAASDARAFDVACLCIHVVVSIAHALEVARASIGVTSLCSRFFSWSLCACWAHVVQCCMPVCGVGVTCTEALKRLLNRVRSS